MQKMQNKKKLKYKGGVGDGLVAFEPLVL